jgi:hypothetical protein
MSADPEFKELDSATQKEIQSFALFGAPVKEPTYPTHLEAGKKIGLNIPIPQIASQALTTLGAGASAVGRGAASLLGPGKDVGNRLINTIGDIGDEAAPKALQQDIPKMAPPSTTLDDVVGLGASALNAVGRGASAVNRGAAKLMPFPGVLRALTEDVPEAERNLGTLVNPMPTAVTDVFQGALGFTRKYLPHDAAKLIEDAMNALPSYPKGMFAPLRQIPTAVRMGRAVLDKVDDAVPRGEPAFVRRPIELTPEMVVNKSGQAVDKLPTAPIGPPTITGVIADLNAKKAAREGRPQALSRLNLKETSSDPVAQDIAERMNNVGEGLPGQIQKRMLEQEAAAAGVTQPTLLSKIADDLETQTMARRQAEGQRGSVTLPGRPAEISTSTGDAALDSVLTTTATQGVKQKLYDLKEKILTSVDYQREIKDQPLLVDNIRIFQSKIGQSYETATKVLTGLVSPLKNRAEKEVFSKIINLRDMINRLEEGQSVQGGMTIEQARSGLSALQQQATPGVLEAVENHFRVTDAIGNEKIMLGTMHPNQKRSDYFQHKVLQYEGGSGVGVKRLRVPGKEKTAAGSELAIERDYEKVMYDYVARHEFQKAQQAFINENISQLDRTELIQARLGPDFKINPGQIVDVDGVRYKGYQPDPGRNIYPTAGIKDAAARDGIKQGLDKIEIPIEEFEALGSRDPATGQPIRSTDNLRLNLTMGGNKRTYALPLNVAEKFEKFAGPALDGEAMSIINKLTNKWKGLTINFGATAYQVMNAIGDVANIARADILSPLLIPRAARTLLKGTADSKLLVKLAEEMDVINSGFYSKEVSGLRNVPEFARLGGPWAKAKIPYNKTIQGLTAINNFRENVPRMALFLKNAARLEGGVDNLIAQLRRAPEGGEVLPMVEGIQAAKPLKTGGTDITGLPPVRGIGKIAREVSVDYGKFTVEEAKYLRGALLPFYAWSKQNTQGWVNYAAQNPGGLASKVLIPWAAMEVWNHTQFGSIEEQLPEYTRNQPHIITGWNDKNGKPIVISLRALPASSAMEVVGLNKVPGYIGDLMQEKITLSKAGRRLLHDVATAPGETVGGLLTPLIKTPFEIATNYSLLTGGPIVPKRMEGTSEAAQRYARYGAESAFRPAREARLLSEQLKRGTFDPVSARFGLGLPAQPIDLNRAVVNNFFDRMTELDAIKNQAELARRQGKNEELKQIYKDHRPELAEWARLEGVNRALGPIRRRLDLVEANTKISGTEKEAESSKLRGRMATIIKRSMKIKE